MDIDLPDSFRTVLAVMASDWYQKPFFVFFLFFYPARSQQTLELFLVFLYAKNMKFSCSPCLSMLFAKALFYAQGEKIQGRREVTLLFFTCVS